MLRLSVILALVGAAVGCRNQPAPVMEGQSVGLVFLTREGCANTAVLRANLDDALRSLGLPPAYQFIDLAALPRADARTGYPTPTLLYANRDVFGLSAPQPPLPEPT